MKRDEDFAKRLLRRKLYANMALLLIDEPGFQPMDRLEASLFFLLISYHYQRGSTLITVNRRRDL